MNFDEALTRAVDTLGDRLRDDLSRELHLLVDELSASAKADREEAASLAEKSATEQVEAALAQAARAVTEAADVAEAVRARAEIDTAEAVRTAVEAVRAEHAAADRATTVVPTPLAETAAPAPDQEEDEDDAGDRFETIVGTIRAIDQARSLSEVLDALVAGAGHEAARAGVLLVRGGRVRGFRFTGFAATFDATTLDVGLSDAGIIRVAVDQNRPASSASDGGAPAFADLGEHADSTEAIAFPIAVAGEVVAVLYVDQPDPEPGVLGLEPAAIEVLARHTARALEALTAFKTVRSIAVDGALSAGAGAHAMNSGGGNASAEDEDEAARRYARLVISEIKLYHEDAVAEGRRDRTLATRLGGEIARARALYEQRVPAHLRGADEHFHAELVRTLAGGDASLFAKASVS